MTSAAAADPAFLFGWGDLRHTLTGCALKDMARAVGGGVIAPEQALAMLDDPILASGFDEAFFRLLAEDVERHSRFDYAELAFHAAHLRGAPNARRLLERLLELAAPDPTTAEHYALLGLDELADSDSPLFAARCHDALGRAIADHGEFREAASRLVAGAELARAAQALSLECDMLGAATACRQLLGDHLRALSLADRWVTVARDLGDARRLGQSLGQRGNAQLALGRDQPARADLEEALSAAAEAGDEQTQSNWLGNLGNLAHTAGNYAEAIRRHSAALELSRRLGSLESLEQDLHNLAQVYWEMAAWDDALHHQREAVSVAEQRGEPAQVTDERQTLQRMYSQLGRHEQADALERLERELEDDVAEADEPIAGAGSFARPAEDPDLDAELDAVQREGGRPEALLELLDARIVRDADNPVPYVKRGIVLAALRRRKPALEAYEKAIGLAPRWLVPHVNAINVWEEADDLDTPRARYERMVADDPFDPLPRTVLGRIYGCEARHDEAIRELREALRLAPGDYDVSWELALELDELAREQLTQDWSAAWATFEQAMVLLEQLPRLRPEARPRALAQTGRIYIRMAESSTQANPPILAWLGDRELDVWVRGIIKLTEATPALALDWPGRLLSYAVGLLVNTADAGVAAAAGEAFERHDMQDLAIQMLEHSIAINPHPAEPRFHLARLLADSPWGERDRAIELLESVNRDVPDHADARGLLTRLRREGAG